MSEGTHDLASELPEYKDRIRELRMQNLHFSRLVSEYHELAKELHQIQAAIETPSDDYTEGLKKRRLATMDEIMTMLRSN